MHSLVKDKVLRKTIAALRPRFVAPANDPISVVKELYQQPDLIQRLHIPEVYEWRSKNRQVIVDIIKKNTKFTLPTVNEYIANNLLAHELVGVQPLENPVGTVFSLRHSADPQNALSVNLAIEREIVEAKPLKLSVENPFEDHHSQAVSSVLDINQILIRDLQRIAIQSEERYGTMIARANEPFDIACKIVSEANGLAMKNRRGAGNWCLMSLNAFSHVTPAMSKQSWSLVSGLTYYGGLIGHLPVYVDLSLDRYDPILIGYNGSTVFDTGYIYSPFIPAYPTVLGLTSYSASSVLEQSPNSPIDATCYYSQIRLLPT